MAEFREVRARPVDLFVVLDDRRDLIDQIYRQVRAAILDGRLRSGDALPSTRELAERLAVSHTAVGTVYERLRAKGLVRSRAGAGVYVNDHEAPLRRRLLATSSPLRSRARWDGVSDPSELTVADTKFDFRIEQPDLRELPYATWRALIAGQLRLSALLNSGDVGGVGHRGLRAAIAEHLSAARAVRASAQNVLVTSGVQQGLDLIGRVLLEPGDLVAIEDPGSRSVYEAFAALDARVVGVPVDADGIVVDALPGDARLVCVRPQQQLPLGMTMSRERRLALLEWAELHDAAIVEDDRGVELSHGGPLLETLQGLDRTGRVLLVGSYASALLPILRLGYVVAPPTLQAALRKAKVVVGEHLDLPLQAAAAKFIDDGSLARHMRRLRGVYAARHRVVRDMLDDELGDFAIALPSVAGGHITVLLAGVGDDREVAHRAASVGVALHRLSTFGVVKPAPAGLVLGYGAIAADAIPEGVRRVRQAIESVAGR